MKNLIYYVGILSIVAGSLGFLNVSAASISLTPKETVEQIRSHFQNINDPAIHFDNLQNNGNIWWIASDKSNILIQKAPHVTGYITPTGIHEDYAQTPERTFTPKLQNFVAKVNGLMLTQGFTKDTKNSSKTANDMNFYDFVQAYRKNNTVCILKVDPDNNGLYGDPSKTQFDLGCSNELQKYYHDQHDFLKAIPGTDHAVVVEQKRSGDFVRVSVNFRRTGEYAILKKINGNYTLIFEGQDQVPCNTVKQNNIPKEIAGECSDYTGAV